MLTQLRKLNLTSLTHFQEFLISGHKESIRVLDTLPPAHFAALSYRVTRKTSYIMSDKPNQIVSKIRKRILDRSEFAKLELNTIGVLQRNLAALDPNGKITNESEETVKGIMEQSLLMLYQYEDYVPLHMDINTYMNVVINRERMISLVRGEELRDFTAEGIEFDLNTPAEDLIWKVVKSSHWPALAVHIKRGVRRYTKRKRQVITALCNEMTKLRIYLIEEGQISSIMDQTGYDIIEEDGEFHPTSEVKPASLVQGIIHEIGPDIAEHFENRLNLMAVLIGLLEMCHLMGADTVCLIHHYED